MKVKVTPLLKRDKKKAKSMTEVMNWHLEQPDIRKILETELKKKLKRLLRKFFMERF